MLSNLLISVGRVAIDSVRDQKMGHDIESELNHQFTGREREFTNYKNDDVKIAVESVTVRPKYSPKEYGNGIAELEADNFFTDLESERSSPTVKEKINAVVKDQWITVVRLNIQNGGTELVRPPGLPLGYVTSTTSMRFDVNDLDSDRPINPIPQIRVADTHELQSAKLEIKIRYDGSIGDYSKRLSDAIDLLEHIQQNMDAYVLHYLLELHHSVYTIDKDKFSSDTANRAKQLGEYLVGHPVDLDSFEGIIREVREDIEKGDKEN